MHRAVKWIGLGLAAAGLAVLAWPVSVWMHAGQVERHRYPLTTIALPRLGAGEAAEGRRLATVFGCTDCHGPDLQGRPFPHPAPFTAVQSANLTRKAQTYTNADFARAVRQAVRPDGTSLWFMPSDAFTHMSDADLARIIAFIRSMPPAGRDTTEDRPGWSGFRQIASGAFKPEVDLVQTAMKQSPLDAGPQTARGRYLAGVACVECHGYQLQGGQPAPDLMVAASYDPGDFRRLMRTGVAAGGRELPMMSAVARKRFSSFSAEDVSALYDYLRARARIMEDRASLQR